MIPQGSSIANAQSGVTPKPSQTYALDLDAGRIVGRVDGLGAVKQAVTKILLSERFEHYIYSANYGSELDGLRGASPSYVRAEIGRRIKQALTQDDRISDVQDIVVTVTGDQALATFSVITVYGTFASQLEV